MDELKRNINRIVGQLNKDWTDAIKKGEKEGGIDLTEVFAKYSARIEEIDNAFIDCKVRTHDTKKKGWF